MGIKVVAASVDSVEKVAALREGLHVGYKMYAEVDAHAVSEATGAHMQDDFRTILHATGFLLNPEGTVVQAVYATGPVGRFTASEIIRITRFAMDKAKG